jgi:hypothetical protein
VLIFGYVFYYPNNKNFQVVHWQIVKKFQKVVILVREIIVQMHATVNLENVMKTIVWELDVLVVIDWTVFNIP